ncbi:MAG TPA: response regulator transcription factor [Solirubrobacteraceae bacterium]|nr:response regulator transcription factor [Solirubrobacteraceae bacterium]
MVAIESHLFVLDSHSIYRRGVEACLAALPNVCSVAGASTPAEAWSNELLATATLVIVDSSEAEARQFIRRVCESLCVPVIAFSSRCDEESVLAAVEAGAIGVLSKESITPETLCSTVTAALQGTGVMSPEVLGMLLSGLNRVSREVLEPRGLSLSRLTTRERQVLRLIAQGHATHEVARELCYSERTVKNVLHDVVTKLGARSRSHAVADAVRQGLI